MPTYLLQIDLGRCVACSACEVACRQENSLKEGIRWVRVVRVSNMSADGTVSTRPVLRLCRHCDKTPCIESCPIQAIVKRSDGIISIDPEKCNGCGKCIKACHFGGLDVDPTTQLAQKCTLCAHRIDKGLEPSCVINCPANAIRFVRKDKPFLNA